MFIGSSTEGLDVARAIHAQLTPCVEVTIWQDGVFTLNDGTLEALMRALDYFDFAVFALTPDDKVTIRNKSKPCPRDNTLFEFGLFLGHLRKERCFAIAPDNHDMRILSDLHGVTVGRYEAGRLDNNWKAAVSNACAMVSSEIQMIGPRRTAPKKTPENQPMTEGKCKIGADENFSASEEESLLFDLGFAQKKFFKLERFSASPAQWFHEERFTNAFPGVRGLQEIDIPSMAIERLSILLRPPLIWAWKVGPGVISSTIPVWWWRGGNMQIEEFEILEPGEILIDSQELPIRRLVAVNLGNYWQSFVYLETFPKPPTGLYPTTIEEFEVLKRKFGYVHEENGLFNGGTVSRAEFDGGAAIINGKPQRIEDVKFRMRYITPYNLLIASLESPINNNDFDRRLEMLMNGILLGNSTVEQLANEIQKLPKSKTFSGYNAD